MFLINYYIATSRNEKQRIQFQREVSEIPAALKAILPQCFINDVFVCTGNIDGLVNGLLLAQNYDTN